MEGYVMQRKPEHVKRGWNPFSSSSKSWKFSYLVLHGRMLHFYNRKGDTVAKKSFALLPGCTITGPISIQSCVWTFEISFPGEYSQRRSHHDGSGENDEGIERTNSSDALDALLDASNNNHTSMVRLASDDASDDADVNHASIQQVSHRGHRRNRSRGGSEKDNHLSKRVRKVQKHIEKKTEKLVAAEQKAPTKRALGRRKAEFGLPNAKVCREWVNAIKLAIEVASATENGLPSSTSPSMQRRSSQAGLNFTSPIPRSTSEQPRHGKHRESVTFSGETSLSPQQQSEFFEALTSSRYSILKAHGDGDGDDAIEDITYTVHRVHGNMVVHREVSPEDKPTVMDLEDKTTEYNETVLAAAVVGLITGLFLNWMGFGVSIQLLLGWCAGTIPFILRIYNSDLAVDQLVPTYMTTQIVRGSPEYIFNAIMNEEYRNYWDVAITALTVLDKRDKHCDIVHMVLKPVWIPVLCLWSKTRELVLLRYWRREADGSFYVVSQSTEHPDAPINESFHRAHMPSAAWMIRPQQTSASDGEKSSVTFMIKYDAGGVAHWLNKLGGFDYSFAEPFLNSVASLADCLKITDFIQQPGSQPGSRPMSTDTKPTFLSPVPVSREESEINAQAEKDRSIRMRKRLQSMDCTKIRVNHAGLVTGVTQRTVSVDAKSFAEPAANNFKVRGPDYLKDGVKISAGLSTFHLVAFDVYAFENPEERYNIASRPGSFPSLFKNSPKRMGKHFTYVINLIMPSNDNINLCVCFQPEDPNWRDSNDPWAKLFKTYIESEHDYFKTRFKLIPRIVEGNFMIRKTVPAKPALIANKGLNVPFHRDEHYFEVDVDITSDTTAKFITKLCLGASRSIVVDMAFLVESKEAEELPETVLGTVRCSRLDLRKHKTISSGQSLGYD